MAAETVMVGMVVRQIGVWSGSAKRKPGKFNEHALGKSFLPVITRRCARVNHALIGD